MSRKSLVPVQLPADPTQPLEAATKQYVDAAPGNKLAACRVATTAAITLSGTQTIEGVAVVAGDRVLVRVQSPTSNNGVYVVSAGAWSRAADADTAAKLKQGTEVYVAEGTNTRFKTYRQMNTVTTFSDAQIWRTPVNLDVVNWLSYPIPTLGTTVHDSNSNTIAVYDGYGWARAHGAFICTSTTRPSNPVGGNIIYETDTTYSYIYDGSTWRLIGDGVGSGGTTIPPRLDTTANTVGDWNLAIQNGWHMGSGAANAPLPSFWFIGQVTVHNSQYVTQEVWNFTEGPETPHYRRHQVGGVWSAWIKAGEATTTLRPVGEVTMFYGPKANIPAGWLPLDGSTFSSTTYPALYALLATTTLPDMADRGVIGAGVKAIGVTGGSATKPTPVHTHTVTTSNHTHGVGTLNVLGVNDRASGTGTRGTTTVQGATATDGGETKTTSGATGSAFDVMNPYLVMWHIIRAL